MQFLLPPQSIIISLSKSDTLAVSGLAVFTKGKVSQQSDCGTELVINSPSVADETQSTQITEYLMWLKLASGFNWSKVIFIIDYPDNDLFDHQKTERHSFTDNVQISKTTIWNREAAKPHSGDAETREWLEFLL